MREVTRGGFGGTVSAQPVPGTSSTWAVAPLAPEPPLLPAGPAAAHRRNEPLSGRVLLAEDSPELQRIMSYQLTRSGIAVEVVADGRAAVREALTGRFDLVLMDMEMPEQDGFAATAELRASGYTRPIIAVTAHDRPGDRERCLRAGCSEYLAKPLSTARLRAVLVNHFNEPPAASDHPTEAVIHPTRNLHPTPPSEDEDLRSLVRVYEGSIGPRIARLRGALREGNLALAEVLAHQTKGGSALFGYPEIGLAAAALDGALRRQATNEELQALAEGLSRVVRERIPGSQTPI